MKLRNVYVLLPVLLVVLFGSIARTASAQGNPSVTFEHDWGSVAGITVDPTVTEYATMSGLAPGWGWAFAAQLYWHCTYYDANNNLLHTDNVAVGSGSATLYGNGKLEISIHSTGFNPNNYINVQLANPAVVSYTAYYYMNAQASVYNSALFWSETSYSGTSYYHR